MKVLVIFIIIVAPGLSLQQHHCVQADSCSRELDESGQSRALDYDQSSPGSASRRHRHKKHISREDVSADLEAANEEYIIRHSEKRSPRRVKANLRHYKQGYFDNCASCDCMKCDDLQQCCQQVCSNECEQPEQNFQQPRLSPGNLVFVPYPYPLVVPPPAPVMPLLPMLPPTTARSITTSTGLSISDYEFKRRNSGPVDKDTYLDLLRTLRYRKESQYSRDRSSGMRPVKQYIPEYGAISDHLIDQLMSQVRNVKDIQSTMDH